VREGGASLARKGGEWRITARCETGTLSGYVQITEGDVISPEDFTERAPWVLSQTASVRRCELPVFAGQKLWVEATHRPERRAATGGKREMRTHAYAFVPSVAQLCWPEQRFGPTELRAGWVRGASCDLTHRCCAAATESAGRACRS